ncbi:MAG: radical SAM protein [Candidatus Omnitrophota bacterium]|jgi:pyruvate formate-lyase activating enzyme-like uncharacterized protein
MDKRESDILSVKRSIGWVYSDLKWLSQAEALEAGQERSALLASLGGMAHYSFLESKIFTGSLSRGCQLCGQGRWSCLFMNYACNKNCFYCPQDKQDTEKKAPVEEVSFNSPQEYVDYLKAFGCKGAGLSGGEPFIAFEKLITYVKTIRACLGKQFYIWVYTNGDLVTREKLKALKGAGLNEIRFNTSARGYDLKPVKLAVNIIDTVTVEIPMIPEDLEPVKQHVWAISALGVKHLNIHQLHANEVNYKNYRGRGYTFLHQPGIPVLESEIAALRLIKFALSNKIPLSLHYCSSMYKDKFQNRGYRCRKANLLKDGFEDVTDAGYIRRLSIQGTEGTINKIVKSLQKKKACNKQWAKNGPHAEVFIRLSLVPLFDDSQCCFSVTYFTPVLGESPFCDEMNKEIRIGLSRSILLGKNPAAHYREVSKSAIQSFYKIFLEKQDERSALGLLYRNYNLRSKEDSSAVKKGVEFLKSVKTWELIEPGFPEIY